MDLDEMDSFKSGNMLIYAYRIIILLPMRNSQLTINLRFHIVQNIIVK